MLLSSRYRALRTLGVALFGAPSRVSRLDFRVQPWDVDLNVHLTNGRYPQLMDVGRLDLIVRSGVAMSLYRKGLRPVAVEQHLVFRRELPLGQRFTLRTEVTGRHRRALVFEQVFEVEGAVHAEGRVHVVLLGPHGVASPDPVQDALLPPQVQDSAPRSDQ